MSQTSLAIVGAPGSPYSRKLRAALRYRRVAHHWIIQGWPEASSLPKPKVALLPQLILLDSNGVAQAHVDSTPLLRELERRYSGRSVRPPDPVVAFIDSLLEDFADEWLTKAMFHYRWAYAPDIAKAQAILPRWFRTDLPDAQAVAAGEMFGSRQIGRLGVVGSNATTAPVIEESYRRILRLLNAHLEQKRFLFGGRPAAADFAFYGQLTQLTGFDPTPSAIALEVAPRVVAWVDVVEDLSGLEPTDEQWNTRDALPPTLLDLLREVGRVYAPFLLANAEALARGADSMECTIDGKPWVQKPFPYQGKCLKVLRDRHAALASDDRAAAEAILATTGCASLVDNLASTVVEK